MHEHHHYHHRDRHDDRHERLLQWHCLLFERPSLQHYPRFEYEILTLMSGTSTTTKKTTEGDQEHESKSDSSETRMSSASRASLFFSFFDEWLRDRLWFSLKTKKNVMTTQEPRIRFYNKPLFSHLSRQEQWTNEYTRLWDENCSYSKTWCLLLVILCWWCCFTPFSGWWV